MNVTINQRNILRELAKKQSEIAALPVMAEREKLWYDLNDGKATHPLVLMEFHGNESEIYPDFIGVDDVFNEQAFLAHIGKSVKAARGCPLEVLFRDICSVRGEPERLGRAVELTREAFERWY